MYCYFNDIIEYCYYQVTDRINKKENSSIRHE